MTKLRLSLATIVAMGCATTAMAANDLTSAFKDAKVDGRIRMQYFLTDWNDNDGWNRKSDGSQQAYSSSKSNNDSKGLALGGSLIIKTAPLSGVSMGIGAYTTQNPGLTDEGANGAGSRTLAGSYKTTTGSDLFARGVDGRGAKTDFGSGCSVLAQSYIQYDISKTDIRLGRMLMTNPFINPNDTKMIPIAIEGASAHLAEFGDTVITLDYANKIKERGMTYFGNMADTGDTPDAIKNYYRTHYTAVTNAKNTSSVDAISTTTGFVPSDFSKYGSGGQAPAVMIAGIKNKSIKDLELQGWVMNWPDIVRQYMLEANYSTKVSGIGLIFGARYIKQTDEGAGAIITPKDGTSPYGALGVTNAGYNGSYAADINKKGDSDNKIDTHLIAIRAIAIYEKAKLLLSYAQTSEDGDLIAPWRGFPTEGYTRSMTQTDWIANTKSYKAQVDYDFSNLIKGVSALLGYSYYDRDPSKIPYQACTDRYYGNGDTRQLNFDVKYAVSKALEWKVRTMFQTNSVVPNLKYGTGTSTATASEGFGNDTSNRELRIEMNYFF